MGFGEPERLERSRTCGEQETPTVLHSRAAPFSEPSLPPGMGSGSPICIIPPCPQATEDSPSQKIMIGIQKLSLVSSSCLLYKPRGFWSPGRERGALKRMPRGCEMHPLQSGAPQTLVFESHLRSLKHMSLAEEEYSSRIKWCGLESNSLTRILGVKRKHEYFSGQMWTMDK